MSRFLHSYIIHSEGESRVRLKIGRKTSLYQKIYALTIVKVSPRASENDANNRSVQEERKHVICVYTEDFTKKKQVRPVGKILPVFFSLKTYPFFFVFLHIFLAATQH